MEMTGSQQTPDCPLHIFFLYQQILPVLFSWVLLCNQMAGFSDQRDGNEWKRLTEGLPYGANYLSIAFDSNNYIYTQGQYTGIFKSTNNGDNWLRILIFLLQ